MITITTLLLLLLAFYCYTSMCKVEVNTLKYTTNVVIQCFILSNVSAHTMSYKAKEFNLSTQITRKQHLFVAVSLESTLRVLYLTISLINNKFNLIISHLKLLVTMNKFWELHLQLASQSMPPRSEASLIRARSVLIAARWSPDNRPTCLSSFSWLTCERSVSASKWARPRTSTNFEEVGNHKE